MTTSDSTTIKNHAAFIWSVADLLRGDYKQSEYGKVILPLTVLRRLDCVLEPADGEVSTIYSTGRRPSDPDLEPLSQVIATLNERYGTSWQAADRVFYDVVAEKLAARPDIQQQAAANTADNFALVMQKEFLAGVVGQLGVAEDMASGFIDSPNMQADVLAVYAPLIQARAKVAHQEHCPIGELLGPDLESKHLEYKATLRTNDATGVS